MRIKGRKIHLPWPEREGEWASESTPANWSQLDVKYGCLLSLLPISFSFFLGFFFLNSDCSWLSNFLKNCFPSFPSLTSCCPSPFAPCPFSSSLFVLLLFSPSLSMGTATSKTTLWFSVANCSEPWWIWKEGRKKWVSIAWVAVSELAS